MPISTELGVFLFTIHQFPALFHPSSFRLHPFPYALFNISSVTWSNFKLIIWLAESFPIVTP